jgi:hypothetical protein
MAAPNLVNSERGWSAIDGRYTHAIFAPCFPRQRPPLFGAWFDRCRSARPSRARAWLTPGSRHSCLWSRPSEHPSRSFGYFFALIRDQWRSINSTFGVLCIVRVGDCPARCPDGEIEKLKSMIVGGYVQLPPGLAKPGRHIYKKNESVRIIGGAFQGVRALHSGLSPAEKEILLLSILGGARRIAVPSRWVTPA